MMFKKSARVLYALEMAQLQYPYSEDFLEKFAQRWGELDLEAFERALQEGEGYERVFSIFALGYTNAPEIREQLVPFLHRSEAEERWASALSLGRMHEERALPVLVQMLTEFLAVYEQFDREQGSAWSRRGWRYEIWRSQ